MKTSSSDKPQVPQPPLKPIIGNLGELDSKAPIQSMMRLAGIYGPIFKLTLLGRDVYVVSSQELVNELCDESRFNKRVHGPLHEIRAFAGDGLFTAYNSEPNWAKAHRLLMPAFGPLGVRSMFDRMVDIAHQMFVKWERFGGSAVIDVADNMTRLTLDTIALCAFDYRFNSFYQNEMHPFVAAMVDALEEAGQRGRRPQVVSNLMVGTRRRYEADQELLARVAEQLIAERRSDPQGAGKDDLLNVMLNGVDPVSGEKLSDENIRYQMVTFLIAGHETTSGLLSFACYLLLKNPEVMLKARALVDQVLGDQMPRFEHLAQLRYIEQILMESLRLWPTAPAFGVKPIADTLLAGRYPLATRDTLLVLQPMLHRDPAVWGEDAEAFRPDRFEPDTAEKLPPNAWKPFGNGARACIGRPFAMQEAQLVIAMMLQRFDIVMDDPSYQLEIAETLTIKPHGLKIRARSRGAGGFALRSAVPSVPQRLVKDTADDIALPADAPQLLVLYGSNTGSCEMFARRIAAEAPRQGYAATVATLDEYAGGLVSAMPVLVVTASYEGQAPDNAKKFLSWVEGCAAGALDGVRFAVLGCGNRQWARTYQAVPKRVDAALAAAGALRLRARGEADAGGDFFGAFDDWALGLWADLGTALGRAVAGHPGAPGFEVEIVESSRERALALNELELGTVVENRELVDLRAAGARSKRHLQIALPAGMRYRSGDYLAVLARNPQASVARALARFGLAGDTQIVIRKQAGTASALPADYPIAAAEVLAGYVELAQPATRAQVGQLAEATPCPPERRELERLAQEEAYAAEVLGPRVSVLDLLERTPSCALGLARFLAMLPTLRARQYSISSSPLANEAEASLTFAVVDAPALSGQGVFQGVASTYLAGLRAGDRLSVAVRPSQSGFHPPADPKTPIVMVCAGTGVAPFRGFLQERAWQKAAGREVGPALLFFGVDDPEVDYLYRGELAAWEAAGVVELRPAFSSRPEGDVVFVQHRVWQDRADIGAWFRRGAQFYVCGDGRHMAPAVRETFIHIYRQATGCDAGAASAWADRMEHEHGRYVSDVFA
ncbi:bifunctional cytochrome P450/NADPH--P450 reductase [Variovorax saccharolyticus]|uniref:bifunctional cytochrome P450/NADPH--P450 reductase n=1 Tax=Variovorax saccharolyticus TaxID=3053516 RepID=UPI0025773B1E|nr:cytochrome P450 [Variovorax sp. J22R187]MDM0019292.1 cytochrome P450 [Variovorax sp. J22R187]